MKRVERWGVRKGDYLGAVGRVKQFMARLDGRFPSAEELSAVSSDLETIYEKFVKIRSLNPACNRLNLSDEMWSLLHQAGIARRELSLLKDAAGSF